MLLLCLYSISIELQKFEHKKAIKQEDRFSIWKLLKYLMITMITFVAVDIYQAKGYKGWL